MGGAGWCECRGSGAGGERLAKGSRSGCRAVGSSSQDVLGVLDEKRYDAPARSAATGLVLARSARTPTLALAARQGPLLARRHVQPRRTLGRARAQPRRVNALNIEAGTSHTPARASPTLPDTLPSAELAPRAKPPSACQLPFATAGSSPAPIPEAELVTPPSTPLSACGSAAGRAADNGGAQPAKPARACLAPSSRAE